MLIDNSGRRDDLEELGGLHGANDCMASYPTAHVAPSAGVDCCDWTGKGELLGREHSSGLALIGAPRKADDVMVRGKSGSARGRLLDATEHSSWVTIVRP
jgi:hypothetical protein